MTSTRDTLNEAARRLRRAAAQHASEGRSDVARILWRNAVNLRRLARSAEAA